MCQIQLKKSMQIKIRTLVLDKFDLYNVQSYFLISSTFYEGITWINFSFFIKKDSF